MAKARTEVQKDNNVIVRLQNVRLSFPNLFTPKPFSKDDGKDSGKKSRVGYSASFLMGTDDKDKNIYWLKAAINHILKTSGKGVKLPPERLALRSGEYKDHDGYGPEIQYISSRTSKRPLVVDRDRTPLTEEDERVYAGCYVNATVRLWWQDDKEYGKRVNAQLVAVQFLRDGEAFGASKADAEEEFDDLGGGSDDLDEDDGPSLL